MCACYAIGHGTMSTVTYHGHMANRVWTCGAGHRSLWGGPCHDDKDPAIPWLHGVSSTPTTASS